jgi:hypothetical protein
VYNVGLIAAEILLYFVAMSSLFRMRARFGFGVFVAALGTMHFFENYLAAVLYVHLPFGMVASPARRFFLPERLCSCCSSMCGGRRDGAAAHLRAAVRQPADDRAPVPDAQHEVVSLVPGQVADLTLMDQMGWLMVWGTVVLFLDSILIILVYEKTASWFGNRTTLRLWASAACVLTFDQLAFHVVLFAMMGAPTTVLFTGWAIKMVTGACFCGSPAFISDMSNGSRCRSNTSPLCWRCWKA